MWPKRSDQLHQHHLHSLLYHEILTKNKYQWVKNWLRIVYTRCIRRLTSVQHSIEICIVTCPYVNHYNAKQEFKLTFSIHRQYLSNSIELRQKKKKTLKKRNNLMYRREIVKLHGWREKKNKKVILCEWVTHNNITTPQICVGTSLENYVDI